MTTVDLSVLVVTYRNPELTRACLASVLEQTDGLSYEVVVVDNASDDGTPDLIAAEFPTVRLIRSPDNLGFAKGNNVAARAAVGEHLVLLNPDTEVLDGALTRLRARALSSAPGLWGGRTLRPDGGLDPSSCWGRQTAWSTLCFATGASTFLSGNAVFDPESLGSWARDSERDVGVVTGCLLLCRRADWERLGGFDERFFMYGEDADLAERARRIGLRTAITPEATIVHHVGRSSSSSGRKMAMVMRSRVTMIDKHWRPRTRPLGLACLLAGTALRAGLSRTARLVLRRPASFWEDVWARRHDWKMGYQPTGVPPSAP